MEGDESRKFCHRSSGVFDPCGSHAFGLIGSRLEQFNKSWKSYLSLSGSRSAGWAWVQLLD